MKPHHHTAPNAIASRMITIHSQVVFDARWAGASAGVSTMSMAVDSTRCVPSPVTPVAAIVYTPGGRSAGNVTVPETKPASSLISGPRSRTSPVV